ncbi:MAG: hypothetical protein CVU65_13820 [Deltaproteobacteria bacterium HGW-Deltaproteobacteria-22]|jgi:hypothetical protein|nr:MAG: hypothetical protein CVU65_13820 [Deltaproteobacteria bacterium HGW-Deltaproteobacteria-22]
MATKMKPEQVVEVGLKAKAMIMKDRPKLDSRVGAGVIDGLFTDVDDLNGKAPGAKASRQLKMAAGATLEQTLELAARTGQAIRNVCRLAKLDDTVRIAVGVGKPMNAKTLKSVLAGVTMILDGYAQYSAALREAGVLPADIDLLTALRDRLLTDDAVQETRKVSSKDATAARNAAHQRLEYALGRILAAAELAFLDDPARLAMYRELIPSKSAAKKPAAPKA